MSGQIGLEIKLLRERLKLSAKDLARAVGLSPSQMSRLESGQRRVDAVLLSKISRTLQVHPSHFFDDFEGPGDGSKSGRQPAAETPPAQVGRLIRAERRRRHMTAEELAQKIGKGKAFVKDVEGSTGELLTVETLQRIAKALDSPRWTAIRQWRYSSSGHVVNKVLKDMVVKSRLVGGLSLPLRSRLGLPWVAH